MELWEDEKQIEQAIKDKLWEKYTKKELTIAFFEYTHNGRCSFDKAFLFLIKQNAPDWFESRYNSCEEAEKKKIILKEMMINNKKKPDLTTNLGQSFRRYSSSTQNSFDKDFLEFTKKNAPHWLLTKVDKFTEKKNKLLNVLKRNKKVPQQFNRLFWYLVNKQSKGFDKNFYTIIKEKFPKLLITFYNKCKNKKEEILKAIQLTGKVPEQYKNNYKSYVFGKYKDSNFIKKVLKIDSNFIRSNNPTQRKKELLTLSIRPNQKSKDLHERRLASCLSSYTSKKSNMYDPEFDKKIRALRPDWFS